LRTIIRESIIRLPIEEVFDFFSNAENLNLLTPGKLNFKILTPLPVKMEKGTLIDYKISIMGIPFKWRTEITDWEPPFRFVDIQLKGPYKV
jgi:ligand-binding SRPBCC domain-containing protein